MEQARVRRFEIKITRGTKLLPYMHLIEIKMAVKKVEKNEVELRKLMMWIKGMDPDCHIMWRIPKNKSSKNQLKIKPRLCSKSRSTSSLLLSHP